eukprot:jgi/Botrbrau1/16493/Bobra.0142s0087.1
MWFPFERVWRLKLPRWKPATRWRGCKPFRDWACSMACHRMSETLQGRTICMGCEDHVDAARAGHLHCLAQLCERGLFLPLDSPDWASAGEARKCQLFEAAIAGCSSGHADVLASLFSSGWSKLRGMFPGHMQDLWEQPEDFEKAFPGLMIREPFCLAYKLYCSVLQQSTPSCLEALLDAGCRSAWICRIAAREGKADFLALAAKRGCPCDSWVWEFAASTGKLAVLELLASDCAMRIIAYKVGVDHDGISDYACMMVRLTGFAASHGQWECLQILERAGCTRWRNAAESAARTGQFQCLRNLVQLHPDLLQGSLLNDAALGGCLACLEFLEQAGCKWEGWEPFSAACSGSAEALRFCLQRLGDHGWYLESCDWARAMRCAVAAGSTDCMQALYDYGYQCPAAESMWHPGRLAIERESLACLKLAIQLSGPPLASLDVRCAARVGVEMLQLVHELGGNLEREAAEMAADAGQADALRYAFRHGAVLDDDTLEAAMREGSVECLECVFEHGLAVGFPANDHQPPSYLPSPWIGVTPCFRMLRYVCEVMRPAWVQQFLTHAAGSLALSRFKEAKDLWRKCLYVAQRLESPMAVPLDKVVRVRRERAGALAGVFYKAKQLARAGVPSPSLALWAAMDRVPVELQERIAFEAHLICPVTQLGPL